MVWYSLYVSGLYSVGEKNVIFKWVLLVLSFNIILRKYRSIMRIFVFFVDIFKMVFIFE